MGRPLKNYHNYMDRLLSYAELSEIKVVSRDLEWNEGAYFNREIEHLQPWI